MSLCEGIHAREINYFEIRNWYNLFVTTWYVTSVCDRNGDPSETIGCIWFSHIFHILPCLSHPSLVAQHHDVARALWMLLRHGPCGHVYTNFSPASGCLRSTWQNWNTMKQGRYFSPKWLPRGVSSISDFCAFVQEPLQVVRQKEQAYEEVTSLAHWLHAAAGSLFHNFFPKCVAKGSHFIEGRGVETGRLRGCFAVRNHSHPFAPVRNRPPLSAVKGPWPYLWRLLQKVSLLEVWNIV